MTNQKRRRQTRRRLTSGIDPALHNRIVAVRKAGPLWKRLMSRHNVSTARTAALTQMMLRDLRRMRSEVSDA